MLTVGLAGCPFDPRPAPVPCDPMTDPSCRGPAPFEPPLAPENVRNNIEAALERPTIDPNYRDSLNEMFRYIPDQAAAALATASECPTLFDNWNRDREIELAQTVFEASGGLRPTSVTVTFQTFMDSGELNDPRRRYNVRYEVAITFVDSSMTPPTRTDRYGSTAKWDLFQDVLSSSWTLERWEDTAPTAGLLGSFGALRFFRRVTCSG